ncbi:cupin domain-containing protein [Streptomyces tagetis]|uniref:Cupin domain-containing protein n=1 Tax=Streptomyces tagetis TaxID=2820809 RepID=A0A940XJY6_9ACTN|nr:cupin domain-containing protein [Streptomyces sp. RG38]MBQ0825203.1 cupin domain-containing protein [Streptomyces sp. RG38]
MHIADTASATRHRAPLAAGPIATPLTAETTSDRVAVVHLELPAGGGLPEHDHGASEIVLVPLSGTALLRHGGKEHPLTPGTTAHIATGERVALTNPGDEPVSLMVVASPPEFAAHIASWPLA